MGKYLTIRDKKNVAYFYNTKIKIFADGSRKINYRNTDNSFGYTSKSNSIKNKKESSERDVYRSLYKSKQNIIDLTYHNGLISPWEYFVTLTFNSHIVNSTNYEETSKALTKWLDNMRHQNKDMKYIIAPELHKSGRIHFHGIFKNVPNWNLVESRSPLGRLIKKGGLQIYNLSNYKYGFTTISKVQNLEAVSVYISKYITKNLIDLNYKKRFWCSQDLERPKIEYAHFNEETLSYYISNADIKDYKELERENCVLKFISLTSDNIYYIKFSIEIKRKVLLLSYHLIILYTFSIPVFSTSIFSLEL